jgi:hypothetical protein
MAKEDAPQVFNYISDIPEETSERKQELVIPSLEAEIIESLSKTSQNQNILSKYNREGKKVQNTAATCIYV